MVGPEGAVQAQVWSVAGLLAVALLGGTAVEESRLGALETLLARGVDLSDAIAGHGLLALARFRRDEIDRALLHADRAAALIDRFPPASFHTLLGSASVAEIRLARWEAAGGGPGSERRVALRAVAGLARFARVCRIGRPRAALQRGRALWIGGSRSRAQSVWRRGLAAARALGMPLDAALLGAELER
jgi:hypothetical protein